MISSKHHFWRTQEHLPTSCFVSCFVQPEILGMLFTVEELVRARGLSDLMAEKYSVETHISANPQSWFGIEDISRKEDNCTCLYISYFQNDLHFWILKTGGVLHFKRISVEENLVQAGLPKDLPLSKFLADCLQPLSPGQKSSARL